MTSRFPNELVQAVRQHRLIPFVGAGVSRGLRPGLFPGWRELLEELMEELREQQLHEAAEEGRAHLAASDFLDAAEVAFQQLGAFRFNRFLRRRFRVARPAGADLSLVHALWKLRPALVLTTNYDDVLAWGHPAVERLDNDQDDELALMDAEEHPDAPRVWHLHGTIHRLSTIILGGSDYQRLYGEPRDPGAPLEGEEKRQRQAYGAYALALNRLRDRLAAKPLLYVGFSLSDPHVLKQVQHVLQVTKGKATPSFALMKRGEGHRAYLWSHYNIQLVEYEDHGRPLLEMLERLGREAFPNPAPPSPPPPLVFDGPLSVGADGDELDDVLDAKREELEAEVTRRESAPPQPVPEQAKSPPRSPAPGGRSSSAAIPPPPPAPTARPAPPMPAPPVMPAPPMQPSGSAQVAAVAAEESAPELVPLPLVRRPALVAECAAVLERERRLVLLAAKRGGARSLATEVAGDYGERVTWLTPPNHPDVTEAEYCRILAAGSQVKDFAGLMEHLKLRAARLGGAHLVVLRREWGSFEHLKALDSHLWQLMDEGSGPPIHVLVVGGARSAWLVHNMPVCSVFQGAPVREAPDFTVQEVRQLLEAAGRDGGRAEEVHAAIGGHPGLLNEILLDGGALDSGSITERLIQSPVLREWVRERLREDDRQRRDGQHHARWVLGELLADRQVQRLEALDHDVDHPEVRLYFDGLVRRDEAGRTVLRCEAVARIAAAALARLYARS